MRRLIFYLILVTALYTNTKISAQTNYFIDGYHGGVYGHYPLWVTKFIADTLSVHKDWKVNLEIEPESWDTIEVKDPAGYATIKKLINDSSDNVSIEYVNPSYAQSYLYNISEESIIRQFQYGIQKLRQHFPAIKFTTYSSEEPCFTSALPQILKSLGIKYVSLKNPNTCWGGYVKAYGGESLNWIGPDGTSILTVPRYTCESLQKRSTWQTIAWNNSSAYINAAIDQGIQNPVGMCLQDAGWKNGLWLDDHKSTSTQYSTWRNYFKLIENKKNIETWRLSQEDIDVSLVWGAQVLQRIAQQVRVAENKITMAEKAAALAKFYGNLPYPEKKFNDAWRTLLLSQHHDCWIVPYNIHNGKTWAENVKDWTTNTDLISDSIIHQSLKVLSANETKDYNTNIVALNTTALNRNEVVAIKLKRNEVFNSVQHNGKTIPSQIVINSDSIKTILFNAEVPALGYTSFSLMNDSNSSLQNGASITNDADGNYVMKTDLYNLVVDAKHGNIKQLIAKELDGKNFVADAATNFNILRGQFYNDGGFAKSKEAKPAIAILENGPLRIVLQIKGTISKNDFTQTIQLTQSQKRIDFSLHIDYAKNIGIGEDYKQSDKYYSTDTHKAFYNDTCKLITMFPLNLNNQKVYKDAPLDVTNSELSNTFYNSWDSIKNNIIDNWVDVTDDKNNYGMALFSDHVTSYSHGKTFPLALTIQYAGIGLWGRNYNVGGATDIHYALLPHKGKWNDAHINDEAAIWNQPIITAISNNNISNKFIESIDSGIAITSMYYAGNDLCMRLVNNGSTKTKHHFAFNCYADELAFTELNDAVISNIKFTKDQKINFDCDIPLFGFRTIRLMNAKS